MLHVGEHWYVVPHRWHRFCTMASGRMHLALTRRRISQPDVPDANAQGE
ncbi:MAG: hypothetical protein RMI91_04180 [Gemmatales bacterium]|nr:hypothetical protein [Gemmatales bacterium]MDW7993832.1 hypothetical protein [Gemmatales bacterium]